MLIICAGHRGQVDQISEIPPTQKWQELDIAYKGALKEKAGLSINLEKANH